MSNLDTRPAVMGDNSGIAYAQRIADEMKHQYKDDIATVDELVAAAEQLPEKIDNEDQFGVAAKLISSLRQTTARLETIRVGEKDPHYRAAQAVDSVFFSLIDRCLRRDRKAKPGIGDILQGRVDDYQQRKLRAEQERRRVEAERLAREERDRQAAALKLAQEAEERRLAAERAKLAHTKAEKGAIADQAEVAASDANVAATIASDAAEAAYIETLAKPADIVRTRVDDGPLVTMAQEGYAEIVDAAKLDKETLWAFISLDAKEKALRAWARNTGFTQQMTGASIGKRAKSVIR